MIMKMQFEAEAPQQAVSSQKDLTWLPLSRWAELPYVLSVGIKMDLPPLFDFSNFSEIIGIFTNAALI